MFSLLRRSRMLRPMRNRFFSSTVRVSRHEKDHRVLVITLNDPKRLNALTASMGDEFCGIVDTLCGETTSNEDWSGCKDVGAVVLTGAGRAFSAGGDIAFLRARQADTPARNAVIMRRFYERFLSVRRIPVPVVAAINGPAIGAGLCLALACDMRIATTQAKLGITFVGLGIHPGMGATYTLPKLVGPQVAAKMILTGHVVDGTQALADGLVVSIAEDGEQCVEDAVMLASQMAAQAPLAVRSTVRSLRMAHDEGMDRALWREADAQAQVWGSLDLEEGLRALNAREKPLFTEYIELDEK